MVYGAEVESDGMRWQTGELKTKMGIIKRLERAGIAKSRWNGNGYWIEPIGSNKFVLYCRTEYENSYDKSSYTTIEGNMRGSWTF
jgi:hypothetical protein